MRAGLTLYVARHGQCEHNVLGVVAGQNDSPLTELGREQARANGRLLAKLLPNPAALDFYASPLHRTAHTMEILRSAAGLAREGYVADRRLMELDCGLNTWRRWPEIAADFERDRALQTDAWTWRHPQGESLAGLHARVGEFVRSLARDAVIVAHAGSMRMLRAHVLGLSQEATMAYHPPNAGILKLSAGGESYFGV